MHVPQTLVTFYFTNFLPNMQCFMSSVMGVYTILHLLYIDIHVQSTTEPCEKITGAGELYGDWLRLRVAP
jgi:hypothetical protein